MGGEIYMITNNINGRVFKHYNSKLILVPLSGKRLWV